MFDDYLSAGDGAPFDDGGLSENNFGADANDGFDASSSLSGADSSGSPFGTSSPLAGSPFGDAFGGASSSSPFGDAANVTTKRVVTCTITEVTTVERMGNDGASGVSSPFGDASGLTILIPIDDAPAWKASSPFGDASEVRGSSPFGDSAVAQVPTSFADASEISEVGATAGALGNDSAVASASPFDAFNARLKESGVPDEPERWWSENPGVSKVKLDDAASTQEAGKSDVAFGGGLGKDNIDRLQAKTLISDGKKMIAYGDEAKGRSMVEKGTRWLEEIERAREERLEKQRRKREEEEERKKR